MTQAGDVRDQYLSAFQTFSENGAAGAPDWLRQLRSRGIETFGRQGFPSNRDERWRFTSVSEIADAPYELLQPPATLPSETEIRAHVLQVAAEQCLVFVNGRYTPELSRVEGLPRAVVTGSLGGHVEGGRAFVERHLARYAQTADSPFTALSTAFFQDGGLVHVPKNVAVDQPIQLLFLTMPAQDRSVVHPRTLIVIDEGASATLIESYVGLDDGSYWTNAVTEAPSPRWSSGPRFPGTTSTPS
jgi:Fe-S cluster assembly protein SufD